MTSKLSLLSIIIYSLVAFTTLEGYNRTPRCFEELERHFFDSKIVEQALSMQEVPKNTWPLIVRDLNRRSGEVSRIVRDQTRRMRPNPLRDPFDAEEAEKILLDALYGVFYDTLMDYNVENKFRIREMFDYIKSQQRGYWDRCFQPSLNR